MKTNISKWLVAACLLAATTVAHAFGGEDPINGNPWHHEMITKDAAQSELLGQSRWTPDAAAAIAWHADYVDSYLYNPLWWAASVPQTGIKRFKASRSVEVQLKSLHFDDLFSTDKVNAMWRRYASGTFAGLMWAAQHDDVPAAQNVLGASLHSVQDFYSHSNWVDDPTRRDISFFNFPKDKRTSTPLWTGSYEHPTQLGVKSHGKYLYDAALFKRPGVAQVMEAACSAFSPLASEDICEDYKASKTGVSVRPTIDSHVFGDVKIPNDVLVLAPAGIALDNTWMAEVGVKQRGITDMTGAQAFQTARALAVKQSVQWLQTMEAAMRKAGQGAFWDKMRATGADDATRFAQYENFDRFPFLFLASGPYPPVSSAEEWYLRIKLKTGTSGGAGTDSDIKLRVAGQPDQTLDWMPGANPILAHNDFEAGDDEVYIAGPYSQPPSEIELYNDSANTGELISASARAVKEAFDNAVGQVVGKFKMILGSDADHIATNHRVWMPDELNAVTTNTPFSMDFNGGSEGHYEVNGTISNVGETDEARSFQIRLTQLVCIKESKWDRGSNSDEPFLVGAISPLPGDTIPYLSQVFGDVDTGESVSLNATFAPVSVPKNYGMLNLALGAFESDDESQKTREQLRDKFVGQIDTDTDSQKRDLLTVIGAYTAPDWQLNRIEVDAWSRNGRIKVGNVLSQDANVWVKGKKSVKFPLSMQNVADTGIYTDELLPFLASGATPTTPGGTETAGEIGTTPDTPTGDPADLDKWLGVWMTPKGELTLTREGNSLRGQIRRTDPMTHLKALAETMELHAVGDGLSIEGHWSWSTYSGPLKWTLKEELGGGDHPGVQEFSGTYSIAANTNPNTPNWKPSGPDEWNGWRLQPPTQPGTGTGTDTATVPPIANPNTDPGSVPPISNPSGNPNANNGGVVPPPTGTGVGGGGFQPVDKLDFRVDETRIGHDGKTLELLCTFRNKSEGGVGVTAGDYQLIITDADGIGVASDGNLYRASGEVPAPFDGTPIVRPNSDLRLRFVFAIPTGVAPLRFMTIRTRGSQPRRFDLGNVKWPLAVPAFGPTNLKNASSTFQSFGADYDVRFDGWKKARDGAYEMFLTFKNTGKKLAGLSTSTAIPLLEDADGVAVRDEGNLYRANGERAEHIAHSILVEPDIEAHIRLRFGSKTAPTKFSLKENYGDVQLAWPLVP